MNAKAAEQARRIRVLHAIHAVLGAFLIAGGVLKIAAVDLGAADSRFLAIARTAFSIAEILGGLWMIAGYDPERTRPWVIAAFVGLWATSAWQAVAGKCSCGCFGSLAVSPWLVMFFDLAAVVVLLKWSSREKGSTNLFQSPQRIMDLSATACAMILLGSVAQPPLTVAGTATLGGRPLSGAELEIRGETFQTIVRTDDDGGFETPPVRPGIYAVTLFGRGKLLAPKGAVHNRPPLVQTSRRMTSKQKKAFAAAWRAAETAGAAADAATIWLDLSDCTGSPVTFEYK